jgi:predicted amidohydrolase
MNAPITRRQFNTFLAGNLILAGWPRPGLAASDHPLVLRAAAIQMTPRIGDVTFNLRQAEALVREALGLGAQWVILPEMFTSGAAFHPDMLKAITPVDGEPAQLLKNLARQGNAVVGGSFLASREGHVFNSFLLAHPDGTTQWHDKDQPTYWENCYYEGGKDDGLLDTPVGPVGSVLCWEFIRSRTARRLAGKVRMVVGGSTWWTLPDDAPFDSPLRADNLKMLKDAPPRLARMLGVPVVHGSHAGPFNGFYSPDLPDVPYDSTYLGETMIVDAKGRILARRSLEAGAGVVVADIELPAKASPVDPVPDDFWIPPEMPEAWKSSWERWLKRGAHYYREVTLPYLEMGEIRECLPEYL